MIQEHGEDTDEYNVRVKWLFPNAEQVDDKWYVPLFRLSDVNMVLRGSFTDRLILWVDPSW
jgi:hypothetical protein